MNQNDIEAFLKADRERTFKESRQLSLGQIIKKIEDIGTLHGDDNEPKYVCFDFGSTVPTSLDSWRGRYAELALGYRMSGRHSDYNTKTINAEELLTDLKSAIGKTFTGWKGGNYVMSENTPVWVDNPGDANYTGITDVIDNNGYGIILITQWCEF